LAGAPFTVNRFRYTFSVPCPKKEPSRQFEVGDKIKVNLHNGKIEDAAVRAVVQHEDGLKLQVDFGHEQTALIPVSQVVEGSGDQAARK
jgi:hypothetical protein